MLPTYFVWNELNEETKKCSDIDKMFDIEQRVGFSDDIESNIAATIEMKNCKPGYLRLMTTGSGGIFEWKKNIESIYDEALQSMLARMSYMYKYSFDRGPATTKIHYADLPNQDDVLYYRCSSWPPIAPNVDRPGTTKQMAFERNYPRNSFEGMSYRSQATPKQLQRSGCRISILVFRGGIHFVQCVVLWTTKNVSLHSKLLLNIQFTH